MFGFVFDLLWKIFEKLQGYIKYCLVGSVGFGIHLLVLWFFTEYAHLWYMASAVIAIIVSAINNYALNYLWTFKDKKSHIDNIIVGYFKYLLSRGFTEGLYLGLLYVMTDIVGLHYMMSAIVVQILTAFIGYLIAVKWIWAKRKNKQARVLADDKVF